MERDNKEISLQEIRILCELEYGNDHGLIEKLSEIDPVFLEGINTKILHRTSGKGVLQNIDDILASKTLPSGNLLSCNTYPFGKHTDILYPRYLGICRDGTMLGTVLEAALEWSKKVAKQDFSGNKTVVILTDKWNIEVFQRYEKRLLNFALKYKIWYVFLLVTDYGFTQIPFFPNRRDALDYLRGRSVGVTVDEMLEMLHGERVEYCVDEGTWSKTLPVTYTFYFSSNWWTKENMEGNLAEGKICRRDILQFLESVTWLADRNLPSHISELHSCDAAAYKLSIFGKSIEWDFGAEDDRFRGLQEALSRLVENCEKHQR